MHSTWDRDYVTFVRAYRKGQTPTCWVNPEKPSQAVLAIDLPIASYAIMPGVGSLFVLVGTALLISPMISLRRPKNEEPAKPNVGAKRVLPVYNLDELSIERTPTGVYCRFPRRRGRAPGKFGHSVIAAVVLLAIGFGIFAVGRYLRQHESPPSLSATVFVLTVSGVLGLLFAASGCLTLKHEFFATFGHSEVVLRGGRISGGERARWLWLGRSMPLRGPVELVVYRNCARPPFSSVARPVQLHGAFATKYHDEGLAILDVRTASGAA